MLELFFSADNFNQDLSGWNVDNVTNCSSFYYSTDAWSLPKPNFTNCSPD
jgi:surface protein